VGLVPELEAAPELDDELDAPVSSSGTYVSENNAPPHPTKYAAATNRIRIEQVERDWGLGAEQLLNRGVPRVWMCTQGRREPPYLGDVWRRLIVSALLQLTKYPIMRRALASVVAVAVAISCAPQGIEAPPAPTATLAAVDAIATSPGPRFQPPSSSTPSEAKR